MEDANGTSHMKRKKTDYGIVSFCDVPKIRRVVVESQRGAEGFH